jgi:hypothetical protein
VTGNLSLIGTSSPLTLNTSAGTAGQVLTSAGAGATPIWTKPNVITTPTTINVPADYPTIQAALASLSTLSLGAEVTIKVADGTYVVGSSILLNHPFADRIRLIGNETNPDLCVLIGPNPPTFNMLACTNGNEFGYINGFKIDLPAKAALANNYSGIIALNGSVINCGPKIKVNNYYYGINASYGSMINADYAEVSNAGDVGIWAFCGSQVNARNAKSDNCSDIVNNWGFGFQAEYASNVDCEGATASGNYIAGFAALSNSQVRALNTSATSNGSGYKAQDNASIEAHNAVSNSNSLYGYFQQGSGRIFGSNLTGTGNGTALFNSIAYFDNSGSIGARVASSYGELRLDTNDKSSTYFNTQEGLQFEVSNTDAATSHFVVQGGAASNGNQPVLRPAGTATDISSRYDSKGAAAHYFNTGGGLQFQVDHTSGAVNRLSVTGSASGAGPTIAAVGTDTNINLVLNPKGSGVVSSGPLNLRNASSPLLLNGVAGTTGQVLTSAGAGATPTWTTLNGSGTVTSVNVSGGTTGLSFSGGPITTSGTITISGTLAVANGGTGTTTSTGTGATVRGTAPAISAMTVSVSSTFTAGTNAQGQGQISNDLTIVTSTSGTSGVTLPTATAGRTLVVRNHAADNVNVYPASGASIDAGATDASVLLPPGHMIVFRAMSTSRWVSSLMQSTSVAALVGTLQVSQGGTGTTSSTGTGSVVFSASPTFTGTVATANLSVTGTLSLSGTTSPISLNSSFGGAGQVLTSAGAGATPTWTTPNTGTVTSVQASGGTTGLTFSGGPVTSAGTLTLSGTLGVANGGTGTTTSTGTGSVVLSASPTLTGTLTTGNVSTSGTLALVGTASPLTLNGLAGTSGQVLTSTGAGTTPTWTSAGTVTSVQVSGGATGLTFSGGPITSSGTITMTGTLAVASGGTGVTTSTGTGSVVLSASPSFTGTVNASAISMTGALSVSGASSGISLGSSATISLAGSVGTAGNVLLSAGAGATPTWGSAVMTTGNQTVLGTKRFTAPILSRLDSTSEGGYIGFARASDDTTHYYWQASGAGTTPVMRLVNVARGVQTFSIDNSGNVVAEANITAYSDQRLKTDLVKIDNALEKVISLNGYTYTRIDSGDRQTGLVAQDVQKVLPEAVMEQDNGILSVAYGNMVGLLVEAIKEQSLQIQTLQEELRILKGSK